MTIAVADPIHSPGPWRAVMPRSLWHVKDARGHFVMEGGYSNFRQRDDAFLIAAAPELLAALIELSQAAEQNSGAEPSLSRYNRAQFEARRLMQRLLGGRGE